MGFEKQRYREPGLKRDWTLTQSAFSKLLGWLDQGGDSRGERYLELRRRLVLYFDRKNCPSPDDLADETLNRVARRLEEEGAIVSETPAHYCYTVARFVLLEFFRSKNREEPLDKRLSHQSLDAVGGPDANEEQAEKERRWRCLERCIDTLDSATREIIVAYYREERRAKIENRRAMAARLGISVNALSIRACRIRDKLESCMNECRRRGG